MNNSDWEPKTEEAKEIYFYLKQERDIYNGNKIRKWLNSQNTEALAVLYAYLDKKYIYMRIVPPLTFLDYYNLIISYFSRCFKENPDDNWIHSRYNAGHDLVNYFKAFWKDTEVPRKYLTNLKNWLAKIYREGDKEMKDCIINAVLEHLCEDKSITKFFSDWQNDPELKEAYISALEWKKGLKFLKKK